MSRHRRTPLVIASLITAVALVAGCGQDDTASGGTATTADTAPVTVRVGYFPNLTHAPALVAVHDGLFAKALPKNATLETKTFNAGPEAVEAIFAGTLDVAYLGPNPAINAFQKSKGDAVRVISGAASGGAFFVVQPGITTAADLKGTTVADPKLGGTQDVALRTWLAGQGLATDTSGGGDVTIAPQENADTLAAFTAKTISGAWVPEPWATRLVQEGGGKILVDEATLWPGGKYPTTVIVASTPFLKAHPAIVTALLGANIAAIDAIGKNPAAAQVAVNAEIEKVTGKKLKDGVITAAWKNLTFTSDPVASAFKKAAADAKAVGLLQSTDLNGLFDLSALNRALGTAGQPTVPAS